MAKAILIIEVPDNCYKIAADIQCFTPYQVHIHENDYDEEQIEKMKKQYKSLQPHLELKD